MIRRFIPVVLIVLFAYACGSKTEKAVDVTFAALIENPAEYVGKTVAVEGTVVHVCKESGKKLFIVGDDPDTRLFISAGENIAKFPLELLGSKIKVEGKIEQVVTAAKPAEEGMGMATSTEAKACSDSAKKAGAECAAKCDSTKMSVAGCAAKCDSMKAEAKACCDTVKKAAECETEAALAKQTSLRDIMMIYNKHEVVK